jgi:ABC-type nitrate/sulfonate/bicarbonate transport system substrate-binding protein
MNASVKVMNSYDYCHFEVALSAEDVSIADVDNLRKEAQRLVDKSIKQYKVAKRIASQMPDSYLESRVRTLRENTPQSEWTPEQKAMVKAYNDAMFASSHYDYQDDWDDGDAA